MSLRRLLIALTTVRAARGAGLRAAAAARAERVRAGRPLPPSEQLPAAPLLITAYAFVWIALMVYVWSIWRRLNKVEDEMRALERQKMPRR